MRELVESMHGHALVRKCFRTRMMVPDGPARWVRGQHLRQPGRMRLCQLGTSCQPCRRRPPLR